ncbi:sensor histidine kinase [Demetria terragena]|uniref:sensor histidine kinase n=1 Tax=Demetria terragena TaxID=63959 RepID=UPI0003800500|nr:sensor histidine kinase [Demetria terragena]
MPTLNDVLDKETALDEASTEWLHALVGDWQLLSDLSFGDLVLWVRRTGGAERPTWIAAAHVRPTTGVGIFVQDLVGQVADAQQVPMIERAYQQQQCVPGLRPAFHRDAPVREEAVPVIPRWVAQPIAIVTRHSSHVSLRTPSRLEVTYLATADALTRMIAQGQFPTPSGQTGRRRGAPRVGDGVMRLAADGTVTYASPNAVSAINRLGFDGVLPGARLIEVVSPLIREADEEQAPALTGQLPWATEVRSPSATMTVRAIPLHDGGTRVGSLLLVRDVSEVRRRERELLTKDATIREIHHRVKNNLQTVAAVLRLQGRRLEDPDARAALNDAGRRVATIALVHESLSQHLVDAVDFTDIARRGLKAAIDVANRSEAKVHGRVSGTFGAMRSEDATVIAMVLAELVQNAVEHGSVSGGTVTVHAARSPLPGRDEREQLEVQVSDQGPGLPPGFQPGQGGLGLRIVLSLVQDLGGDIEWSTRPEGGTVVRCVTPLRRVDPAPPVP